MPKFTLPGPNGYREQVDGRKFSHYIGNIQYWFFHHFDTAAQLKVSAIDSGYSLGYVPYYCQAACLGDNKAAAKQYVDILITKHGVDDWCSINRKNFYQLRVKCSNNRECQRVDEVYSVSDYRDESVDRDTESEVVDIVRRLARWLYDRLREDVDYQNSEENVDEYEFDESGRLAA